MNEINTEQKEMNAEQAGAKPSDDRNSVSGLLRDMMFAGFIVGFFLLYVLSHR